MKTSLFTLSGSSGAGKTSYIRNILKHHPQWRLIVSHTTRQPRKKDLPGEYCHISMREFNDRSAEFLWTAKIHGHYYGTTVNSVVQGMRSTVPMLMPINHESVIHLRDFLAIQGAPSCHLWCLSPPDATLRARLMRRVVRGDMHKEELERRLKDCQHWDTIAIASNVPYFFVPGETTIEQGTKIILYTARAVGENHE